MHYTVIRHRNGVSFSDALMTFGSLVLSLFVIFMCYKRLMTKSVRAALREEVMLEVRSQMADYRQLKSDDSNARLTSCFSLRLESAALRAPAKRSLESLTDPALSRHFHSNSLSRRDTRRFFYCRTR